MKGDEGKRIQTTRKTGRDNRTKTGRDGRLNVDGLDLWKSVRVYVSSLTTKLLPLLPFQRIGPGSIRFDSIPVDSIQFHSIYRSLSTQLLFVQNPIHTNVGLSINRMES